MLSILLATIASMAITMWWFGPQRFYPAMMKEIGTTLEAQQAKMANKFNPSFHFGIILAGEFTLALIIYGLLMLSNNDFRIMIFPLFFVFVSDIKTNIYTFLSVKLFLIQVGQKMVTIFVMGAIISLMM